MDHLSKFVISRAHLGIGRNIERETSGRVLKGVFDHCVFVRWHYRKLRALFGHLADHVVQNTAVSRVLQLDFSVETHYTIENGCHCRLPTF